MTSIEILRVVLHPVRRRIVEYLHLHGPAQVGTLARGLDQHVGSISHHLRMLERAGIVVRAPELETDGRTSWWRLEVGRLSWSVDDFEASADRVRARAAEKMNIDYQLGRLVAWKRTADQAPQDWREAAVASDFSVMATAAETKELWRRIDAAVTGWRDWCDEREPDGEREPVFGFLHIFPSRP